MQLTKELWWSNIEKKGGIAALSDADCAAVTKFYCHGQQLTELPPHITRLHNLTVLWCNNNQLASLEPVRQLANVTTLWCNDNQLTSLEPLREMTSLTTLWCNNNQLTSLEPLRQLTNVTTMWCYDNQLASLEPLREMTSLTTLYCYGNRLTSLEPLQQLTSLTRLDCENTQLTSLEPLRRLTNLTVLHAVKNQIDFLPLFFAHFTKLEHLFLEGNMLPTSSDFGDLNKNITDVENVRHFVAQVLKCQPPPSVPYRANNLAEELFELSSEASLKESTAQLSANAVSLLLATGKCDEAILGNYDALLERTAKAPNTAGCVLHQLVEMVPWERMRQLRELIQREGATLFASPLQRAQEETDAAVARFGWVKLEEATQKKEQAEALVSARTAAGNELQERCEARQVARRGMLELLTNEMPAALSVLTFLKSEEALLLQQAAVVAPKQQPQQQGDGNVSLDELWSSCDKFANVIARVNEKRKAMFSCAVEHLHLIEAWCEKEAQAERAKLTTVQRELLLLVSEELALGSAVAKDMERAKAAQATQLQKRLITVQEAKAMAVQRLETMDKRAESLKKCLDAEGRKAEVERAAKAVEEALAKSKKRAKILEMSLELGDASQADLDAARVRVEECRRAYEDALRQLLEIRALGYPELRCSAAPKRDQFPNVPEIDAGELEKGTKIGKGAFSDVYEAALPLTGRVALKELRLSESRDELLNEAAAMWEVRHSDHVVQLLKVCTGKRIGLVMEFMEGGTLAQRLKESVLDKRQILEIWRDVLLGVADIHDSKQVHMDLKSDNILLDGKGRAKVGDFGTCKQQRQTMRATRVIGTLRWLAPELLSSSLQQPSPACDIWSVGMILYELVTRREPYHELEESQVVGAITCAREPSIPELCDKDIASWMRMCWRCDASKRPTARQLLAEVEKALTRNCGVCIQDFPVGKGVLCTGDQRHFRCSGCLDDEMVSSECQRVDGAIACNCGGVFDLAHTRLVVQDATFKQWQRKVLAFKEQELKRHHKLELERERKHWQEEDNVSQIVRTIETMLTTACPVCSVAFVYDGGCMAIQCPACKGRFCSFCFQTFQAHEGGPCHDHAMVCQFNSLPNRSIFPTPGQEQQQFEAMQIARIKRNIEATLKQLDAAQRAAVLQRIGNLLAQRGIKV